MHHSIISSASALAFALLPAANGAALGARGGAETVTLSNCENGNGGLSSQMAYFSGTPNGSPGAIAVIQTGSTVLWEGNTVTGTFGDGNTFTSHIVSPKPADQAYAGPAENKFGSFYCYYHAQAGIYIDSSGNTCNMIYYCNHNAPAGGTNPQPPTTPAAQGTARFDFTVEGNYVQMPGHFTAADMLGTIDKVTGDTYCDSTQFIQIGDGSCNINYNCHGDVPGKTTHAMATMLKDVVSQYSGLVEYVKEDIKTCIDTNPEVRPGQDPCIYENVLTEFTKINNQLQMNVVYTPAGNPDGASDQGQLTYLITCPAASAAGPNCGFCKGLSIGLQGASVLAEKNEELMTEFDGAEFVTDAVCALIGC